MLREKICLPCQEPTVRLLMIQKGLVQNILKIKNDLSIDDSMKEIIIRKFYEAYKNMNEQINQLMDDLCAPKEEKKVPKLVCAPKEERKVQKLAFPWKIPNWFKLPKLVLPSQHSPLKKTEGWKFGQSPRTNYLRQKLRVVFDCSGNDEKSVEVVHLAPRRGPLVPELDVVSTASIPDLSSPSDDDIYDDEPVKKRVTRKRKREGKLEESGDSESPVMVERPEVTGKIRPPTPRPNETNLILEDGNKKNFTKLSGLDKKEKMELLDQMVKMLFKE